MGRDGSGGGGGRGRVDIGRVEGVVVYSELSLSVYKYATCCGTELWYTSLPSLRLWGWCMQYPLPQIDSLYNASCNFGCTKVRPE